MMPGKIRDHQSRTVSWSALVAAREKKTAAAKAAREALSSNSNVLDSFPVPPSPIIVPRSPGSPGPPPPSPPPEHPSNSPPPQDEDALLLCDNPPCPELASIICASCNEAPFIDTDPQVAQYCSDNCQQAHSEQHGPHCDRLAARNKLFRCMSVAQKAFLVYREMSWHAFDIKDVWTNNDMIVLKGLRSDEEEWPECFRNFPHDLLSEKNEKLALLSFLSQGEANIWAAEFIHGLLTDIIVEVEMIVHQVKDVPCRIVLDESEDSDSDDTLNTLTTAEAKNKEELAVRKLIWAEKECEVLKVTLYNGEEFAVDLAGAQYGFYDEPVTDWAVYERKRIVRSSCTYARIPIVSDLITASDFRVSTKVKLYHALLADKTPNKDLLTRHLESLNLYFMEWQFDGQISLGDMWNLSINNYKFREQNLLDYVEWKFCRYCKPNLTGRGRAMSRAMKLRQDKWNYKQNFPEGFGDDLQDLVSAHGFSFSH